MTPECQVKQRPPKTIFDPGYIALVERLRVRRLELELTQEDVAERMGTARTIVVRVEQRERRLDVLELRRWLVALGLTMADAESALAGEGHP